MPEKLSLNNNLNRDEKEIEFPNFGLFSKKLKKFYENENKKLIKDFKQKNNGLNLAKKRSFLLDKIICKCYDGYLLNLKKNNSNTYWIEKKNENSSMKNQF